jgi:hypothetical protein
LVAAVSLAASCFRGMTLLTKSAVRYRCPLFSQKRTFAVQNGMSALGQQATSRWNRFCKRPFIAKRYMRDQLSFNRVSRNVSFTRRIFREHNTSRRKAPHVPIASFELDLA